MQSAGGLTTAPSQRRERAVTRSAPPAQRAGFAMARFDWVSPIDRWWLESYSLTDIETLFSFASQSPLWSSKQRETLHLAHPLANDDRPRLTLKRSSRIALKDRLGSMRRAARPWSRQRREWDTLRRLKTLGIECPRPLVCLEVGLLATRACLLTEEIHGGRTLPAFLLDAEWSPTPDERREFFLQLGKHVSLLHGAGFAHGALFAPAIVVNTSEVERTLGVQHVGRARQFGQVDLRRRAFDVAALDATLPERAASGEDRARLLDAYIHASCLESTAGEFLDELRRQRERLLARRRTWEIREGSLAHDDLDGTVSVHTSVWIDPEFRPALEETGLTSVGSVMQTQAGKCLRTLKDRENWRLDLPHAPGPSGAYLKKHHVRTLGSWLRAKLRRGPGDTAGRVEARNIALLRRAGVAAMRLIAFGEQLLPTGELQSFVLTQELEGFAQLDHFLKQHFPGEQMATLRSRAALRTLIYDVADLASKFHRLGYNHRDLYCCHFFVKETRPARYLVHLIDLQRVEHRRRLRKRWIVKDLAQLAYSAPRDQISCSDKLAFIKRYLGVARLRPQDKRLIRQVLAKQMLMEWQLGRHP